MDEFRETFDEYPFVVRYYPKEGAAAATEFADCLPATGSIVPVSSDKTKGQTLFLPVEVIIQIAIGAVSKSLIEVAIRQIAMELKRRCDENRKVNVKVELRKTNAVPKREGINLNDLTDDVAEKSITEFTSRLLEKLDLLA